MINLFLVYNNCRKLALINADNMNQDIKSMINELGLSMINEFDSDKCFITKINIERKDYYLHEIGKMLGYVSYNYGD